MRKLGFSAAAALTLGLLLLPLGAAAQPTLTTSADKADQGFYSDSAAAVAAARKRASEGDVATAIRELSKYVAAHPREVEPARFLGDLYYRVPDLKAAERQYLSILLTYPNDRETHNRLGGVYAAQDRLNDAIAEFQRSLPDPRGLALLVRLHRAKGDLADFEAHYRRAADERPGDAVAQAEYGKVLLHEGKDRDALVAFQKVLDLGAAGGQRAEAVYADMGYAYLDLQDPKNAIAALRRALDIAPAFYSALVNMGEAYIEMRDYKAAKPYFDQARTANPDGVEALVDLGYLEDEAQRWKAAVLLYEQAIAINPLARDAYVNLGYDYREHGMFSLAEAALLKGLSVSPGDAWLHYLLATVYSDQGKKALFRSEIEKAAGSDDPIVAPVARRELARLEKA